MRLNVNIDDLQEEAYIEPIFKAVANLNLSDQQYFSLFVDAGIGEYWKYMPDAVRNNPDYIKQGIMSKLLMVYDIPEPLKNAQFIDEQMYGQLLQIDPNAGQLNLYPISEQIALEMVAGGQVRQVPKDLMRNIDFITKACSREEEFFFHVEPAVISEILKDEGLCCQLIKQNPYFFDEIPHQNRHAPAFLLSLLQTPKGVALGQDYFHKTKNEEVALKVLEVIERPKLVHQMYRGIIKQCGAQQKPHEFLKSFLESRRLNDKLQDTLLQNEKRAVSPKI